MKNKFPIILFLVTVLAVNALASSNPKWKKEEKALEIKSPKNMVFIGSGFVKAFSTNNSNDTIVYPIHPFYMQQTEITNSQYKEFVIWVRDSILREEFSKYDASFKKINEKGDSILNWKKRLPNPQKVLWAKVVYDKYFRLDKKKIYTSPKLFNYKYIDEKNRAAKDWLNKKEKKENITFPYIIHLDSFYINKEGDISKVSISREVKSLDDFKFTRIINIYPDTTCWIKEPELNNRERAEMYRSLYFGSAAYLNYPVVGVQCLQISAYCDWLNRVKSPDIKTRAGKFRLPTELEWDYVFMKSYSPAIIANKFEVIPQSKVCCYLNFKSQKGELSHDAYLITAPVGSFPPNELGLYEFVGNVAEWTDLSKFNLSNEDNENDKLRVVKGNSFMDTHYDAIDRSVYSLDKARCFIGFRLVTDCSKE